MQFFSSSRFAKFISSVNALALALVLSLNAFAGQSRAQATLRVTAHDEAEKPVAAVVVQVKLNGATVATATTNEKGEAEFSNLAPGTYGVAISKEGLETLTEDNVAVSAGAPV